MQETICENSEFPSSSKRVICLDAVIELDVGNYKLEAVCLGCSYQCAFACGMQEWHHLHNISAARYVFAPPAGQGTQFLEVILPCLDLHERWRWPSKERPIWALLLTGIFVSHCCWKVCSLCYTELTEWQVSSAVMDDSSSGNNNYKMFKWLKFKEILNKLQVCLLSINVLD